VQVLFIAVTRQSQAKVLLCEKCFKPMRVYEENPNNFEEYHIRIIKQRLYERTGSPKMALTF
jgi:hypothetical protein